MRKQFFFFLLPLVLLAMAGCDTLTVNVKGEGPVVVADQTPAADFTKLLISIPGNVYITEGPERKVTLVAQENVMEVIQTGITGNDEIGYTFELKTKKNDQTVRQPVSVHHRAGPDQPVHQQQCRGGGRQ